MTRSIVSRFSKAAAGVGTAVTGIAAAAVAHAQVSGPGFAGQLNTNLQQTGTGIYGQVPTKGLPEIIGGIIQAALGLLGIVLVVIIIYAGYLWMTAAGDDAKVTKAKKMIANAVIGMILIFAAYAITGFVITSIITGTSG
jgi:hypothetical protein